MSDTQIEKKQSDGELIAQGSPAEMIRIAVHEGADLDKLAKLLDIQERWDANEAKKAYHKAMSEFKANPPRIEKDKEVSYKTEKGAVRYNHATLANVVQQITRELSKHGLSASWRTKQNGQITVTCRITHLFGHSEETELSASADNSGSKNSIQAIGSTITYLERYTLLALTGLATEDQDDDAQSVGVEFITDEQVASLTDYIIATETDEAKFMKYLGVESLDKMPKSMYQKALNALKTKERKK